MKHGYARYSPEINALRAVQGLVADLRHEAGRIPKGGNGWEGMDLDGLPNDIDYIIDAYNKAIREAESMRFVFRYVNDMYDGDATCAGVIRKAKSMRAKIKRDKKERAEA